MSIDLYDIVTPHTGFNHFITPQRPTFGIVTDDGGAAAAPKTVLWEHGLRQTLIKAEALDKVLDPNAYGAQFIGKVVGIRAATTAGDQVLQRSPEFQGVVVSAYWRQAGKGGTTQIVLVKLFNGGWREAEPPASSTDDGELVVIDNR